MDHLYKVIFKGDLREGFDSASVIRNLATVARMDASRAEKLLLINTPTVLKKGLDKAAAEKLAGMLTRSGLQVSLKGYENRAEQKSAKPKTTQQTSKVVQVDQKVTEKQKTDNPYAAPVADLGVKTSFDSDWLDAPKKVSASQGWKWISSAAKLFFGEPFKWLAMGVLATLVSLPIVLIPIIGSLLYYIPVMILAGGFMIAAQEQMEGNALQVKYIFSGFSNNRNQLALLGVLYLGCMLAIWLISIILIFLTLGANFLPMLMGQAADPGMMGITPFNLIMFVLIILVAFGLSIPMLMAIWFSAPLVALGNRSALQAFKLSYQACMKNILPFLVYGLAFLVIGVIFSAVIGVFMGIFGFFTADGGSMMLMFLLPVILILLVGLPFMMICGLSVYTGFVDIFSKSTVH